MATKTKKDSFGIDADPEEFDIDEWLAGASLPARTVKIYQDAQLRAEYDALEQRFLVLKVQVGVGEHPDEALSATSAEAELFDVAKQMQDIITRLESSALLVKVRALTDDENEKIQKNLKKANITGRAAAYERMAVAVTYPKLRPADWGRMRQKIGEVQFSEITDALVELAGFTAGGQVMPDFSRAASELLSTKGS